MAWSHGRIVGVAVATIIGVQAVVGLVVSAQLPGWEERGQLGDMFGVVNALFSGLAFAGVIYAVLLQREDLKLQREELTLTRKELQRSAEAQEKSEIALALQASAAQQSAKLSAINYLLEYYDAELVKLRKMTFMQNDPKQGHWLNLEQKRAELIGQLNEVFESIKPQR